MNRTKDCENCGQMKTLHAGHEYRGLCPDGSGRNYRYRGAERAFRDAGLSGGGPWALNPECRSRLHNTLYAAFGRRSDFKCICPRALALGREWQDRQNELRRLKKESEAKRAQRNAEKIQAMRPAKMIQQPKGHTLTPPNLAGGACTQPWSAKDVEGGFNTMASTAGIEARAAAARVCGVCPLKQACLDWVTAAEEPRGSWGGVWGGLDPWERMGKRIAEVDGVVKVIDR